MLHDCATFGFFYNFLGIPVLMLALSCSLLSVMSINPRHSQTHAAPSCHPRRSGWSRLNVSWSWSRSLFTQISGARKVLAPPCRNLEGPQWIPMICWMRSNGQFPRVCKKVVQSEWHFRNWHTLIFNVTWQQSWKFKFPFHDVNMYQNTPQ